MSSVLAQLGSKAEARVADVQKMRTELNIDHEMFDCYLYQFLSKNGFKVEEAIKGMQYRHEVEREEFGAYEFTEEVREIMQLGAVQLIGQDPGGRELLYINTRREFPQARQRPAKKQIFDMALSYVTRLRRVNKTCQCALLVNQLDASAWSNTDLPFCTSTGLRVIKLWPGMVDKIYLVNMPSVLTTMIRPILKTLPAAISDLVSFYSVKDTREGKLRDLIDPSVLPSDLGGDNKNIGEGNVQRYIDTIEEYFHGMKDALQRGMCLKEYEWERCYIEEEMEHLIEGGALRGVVKSGVEEDEDEVDDGLKSLGSSAANSPKLSPKTVAAGAHFALPSPMKMNKDASPSLFASGRSKSAETRSWWWRFLWAMLALLAVAVGIIAWALPLAGSEHYFYFLLLQATSTTTGSETTTLN